MNYKSGITHLNHKMNIQQVGGVGVWSSVMGVWSVGVTTREVFTRESRWSHPVQRSHPFSPLLFDHSKSI